MKYLYSYSFLPFKKELEYISDLNLSNPGDF